MKPRSFKPVYLLAILLAAGLTLTLVSWGHKQSPGHFYQQQQSPNDTTPEKKKQAREKKVRDLDDALENLDNMDVDQTIKKAMDDVAEAMKKIDGEKIRQQIELALKQVDMDKIQQQLKEAMKELDAGKLQAHIDAALSDANWEKLRKELKDGKEADDELAVDMDKLRKELKSALKEVDLEGLKKEISSSMSNIDWDNMKKELDKAGKIDMSELDADMKKLKEEMKNLKPELEKQMSKVKEEVEKAKAEIKEYKDFVDGLENDGLLNKKEPYTIVHKDSELTVNGKKVSVDIYTKYRTFLEKHKEFKITKDKDNFSIDND